MALLTQSSTLTLITHSDSNICSQTLASAVIRTGVPPFRDTRSLGFHIRRRADVAQPPLHRGRHADIDEELA